VVRDHIAECKKRVQALRSAHAIIIPETNIPIALELQYNLKTVLGVRCSFMCEDNDKSAPVAFDRPGSLTTRQNKPEMIYTLRKRLSEGRIVLHTHFIVASQEATLKDVAQELIAEFRSFTEWRKRVRLADGTVEVRCYYSGKVAGNNDDFVMAVAIGGYMKMIFDQKEKYRHLR